MGVPRSVYLRFAARVAAPIVGLQVLWGALTAAVMSGRFHRLSEMAPRSREGLIAIAGATAIVIGLIFMIAFIRRLAGELTGLADTATRIAAGDTSESREVTARTRQVARAADAIVRMHNAATEAAATEGRLRDGLRQVLISLGKRNQSLLHRQLRIIDDLEKQAASPRALADLFALDHLTTRMRRHAESLTIVAGTAPARSGSEAVPVIDVIRAAAAEVEDYKRVTVITDAEQAVAGPAVTDMIHLLAELIENATLFSPSSTRVEVKAEPVANGFAIEVEDRGLGIEPGQLAEINRQLANAPDFDLADADRLGLFVVARLAARHGVDVALGPSLYRGTKAVVLLPESIVVDQAGSGWEDEMSRPRVALSLASVGTGTPPGAPSGPQAGSPSGTATGLPTRSAAKPSPVSERTAPESTAEPRTEGGRTLHGLPRRVRSENMPQRQAAAPAEAPAPEHARNLATSLQNSWQRARHNPESEDS